jgi:DnaJ-class molecular chaperone
MEEEIECPHCGGTKKEFPECEECEGKGWVDDPDDGGTMDCPECHGEECSTCNGEGFVERPTPLAPDSLKAGVSSLPESVKVENALPAVSG